MSRVHAGHGGGAGAGDLESNGNGDHTKHQAHGGGRRRHSLVGALGGAAAAAAASASAASKKLSKKTSFRLGSGSLLHHKKKAPRPSIKTSSALLAEKEAAIARREEAKRKMAHDHWVQLKFFTKYGDVGEMQKKDEYEKRWYRRLLRWTRLLCSDQIRVDSHFRHSWDIGMMAVLSWVLCTLPYRLAFGIDPEGAYWWAERMVDLFFVVDIQLNFRTTYVDDVAGVEVFNRPS